MFPTEQQIYHRIRWDPRFDPSRCSIVIRLRPSGTQRVPFVELDLDVIPWHLIVEFWIDDELAWSRPQRIDRLDELARRATSIEPKALDGIALDVEPGASRPLRETLRVVVWNLLFDRHDADLLDSERRWQAAFAELEASDADVLALCEITPKLWSRLVAQRWVASYAWSDAASSPSLAPFGQILLSRFPIRAAMRASLPRDRSVLLATLDVAGHELGVAVVHLTSNRVDDASAIRRAQLAAVVGHLEATPRDAWLVAGDFNADPEEHADVLASSTDLWPAVTDDPGLTFDVTRNSLASVL